MDLQLTGKRALITGASKGLGYATAHLLAAEGCAVAINSRDPQSLQAAAETITAETGALAHALRADLANPAAITQLVADAVAALGGLDLLVTNAGGPPPGPFESTDDAAWQAAIDLSLMAHVRLIRAALPHLRQSAAASILTITSYSAKQPIPNLVLSNSIRLATIGLTKTLSQEFGPAGIRVNSILPGWTETERVYTLMEARAAASGHSPAEQLAQQARETALGRMATPEEFAHAAVFLLSPAASYITGVMLPVDGGILKGTL